MACNQNIANHVHAVYSMSMANRVLKLQIETSGMATIIARATTRIAMKEPRPTLYFISTLL